MPVSSDALTLMGAPAREAVDCMRGAGVLPTKPTVPNIYMTEVDAPSNGEITVTELGKDKKFGYETSEAKFTPAHDGKPAQARTPEIQTTGSTAEAMRKKAKACAFNSIQLKP